MINILFFRFINSCIGDYGNDLLWFYRVEEIQEYLSWLGPCVVKVVYEDLIVNDVYEDLKGGYSNWSLTGFLDMDTY
jgi:hypothetical protein